MEWAALPVSGCVVFLGTGHCWAWGTQSHKWLQLCSLREHSRGDLHVVLVVVRSCAAVWAWNWVLLNLCGHSQLKPEMKQETRGDVVLDRSAGIRAPCMVSPLFSMFQCECLVILSQIVSVLELNCNAGVVWDATCCFHVVPWLFAFHVFVAASVQNKLMFECYLFFSL